MLLSQPTIKTMNHEIGKFALVELGVALYESGSIKESSRKKFMEKWGRVFDAEMHDSEQVLGKIVARKKGCTIFLDQLSSALNQYVAKSIENQPGRF